MSWKYGIQVTSTSSGRAPLATLACSRFASTLSWVSSTPRGAPVLPEENWRKATSSPAGVGSCGGAVPVRSAASRSTGAGRPSVTGAVASSVTTTASGRLSRTARTRCGSGGNGTGTSPAASAPQNIGWKSWPASASSSAGVPGGTPAAR